MYRVTRQLINEEFSMPPGWSRGKGKWEVIAVAPSDNGREILCVWKKVK